MTSNQAVPGLHKPVAPFGKESLASVAATTDFVTSFLAAHPAWLADPEDPVFTTWQSAMLVLFAAAHLGSTESASLTKVTGFQDSFVSLTLCFASEGGWWHRDSFVDLVSTLEQKGEDLQQVTFSYESMYEDLLSLISPSKSARLDRARSAVLFGVSTETPEQYHELM